MADKQRLFAYCTALTLRGRLGQTGGNDLNEAIGCRFGIDMAAHWRPTAKQAATASRWLPDGMVYPVNHEVAEVPVIENELPAAFDLPAAE